MEDETPTYPDGTIGVLMKQRDDLQRSVESDCASSQMYADRAKATQVTVDQLQATIDALT